jgi:adenosine deaminase
MSLESYLRALPKVDLRVHLEGAWKRETLMLLAEENDVRARYKHFDMWVKQLTTPDYVRLDDLLKTIADWAAYGEDITRMVYDLGVHLYKENVRYAEVLVNPALYAHMGLSIEELADALQDGRDRVRRAWGVKLAWLLCVPRDEVKRADDILRYAGLMGGKRNGVVGIALASTHKEANMPITAIERVFKSAERKEIARVPYVAPDTTPELMLDMLKMLQPTRINEGGVQLDSAFDAQALLKEHQVAVTLSMARTLCLNKSASYATLPVRRLLDAGVNVILSADMPSYFKSSLSDEYLAAVEHAGLTAEEIENMVLRAVAASLMSDEDKAEMLDKLPQEFARLRKEHMQTA